MGIKANPVCSNLPVLRKELTRQSTLAELAVQIVYYSVKKCERDCTLTFLYIIFYTSPIILSVHSNVVRLVVSAVHLASHLVPMGTIPDTLV